MRINGKLNNSRDIKLLITSTVNSKIFARIFFFANSVKSIFATLKIHDLGMFYLYQ